MVIDRQFASNGHIVRLAVEIAGNGWDIEEARDSAVIHVEHHDDWRHVEWAIRRLEMEALRHGTRATHF